MNNLTIVSNERVSINKNQEFKSTNLDLQVLPDELNLNYNEVIMCGDNISKDMKGAQALGIKTYLVKLS